MSVGFDPIKLGPRRRRVDPLVVGIVAVAIALAVAVAKPWESGEAAGAPAPSFAAVVSSPAASRSVAPAATTRATPHVTPRPPIWADFAPVVTAHDAWGVRAILLGAGRTVGSPEASSYLDRWVPTTTDADGNAAAYVARDEESIVALGVTVPRAELPQDARIWRVLADDQLEWTDARSIDPGAADGSLSFVRPGVDDASFEPWDSGQYRIDVLVKGGIERIEVSIPGRFGIVPTPHVSSTTQPDLVPASASDPSNVRVGLFATVDGIGVPLAAARYRPLAEDEAWRGLVRTGRESIATAYLPRATGLGVMLTSHAAVESSVIRRLAPGPLPIRPPAGGGISTIEGRTPYALFAAPDGGVWTPGVYAISVVWTDASGHHDGTWHLELRPGPE